MGNLLENTKLCGRTTVFISRASFWKRACQCLAKRPTLLEPPRQKILPRPLFWPSAEQCLRQFQEWPFCLVAKRKNRWEQEKNNRCLNYPLLEIVRGLKSLYRSRAGPRSLFYGTDYEVWANFGLVGNPEKKGVIMSNFSRRYFRDFMVKKKFKIF